MSGDFLIHNNEVKISVLKSGSQFNHNPWNEEKIALIADISNNKSANQKS